ncbi:MAG: hypothetical protein AB7L65_10225 [Hyphomonadaceae bacterium]
MLDTLRIGLSLAVYAGMIALCVLLADYGGLGGLIAGLIGFGWRFLEPGQQSLGERFGNGYAGSLMGLPLGLIAGAAIYYGAAHWADLRALAARI